MLIDPLAAVLSILRGDATIADAFGSRIAEAHRYGAAEGSWSLEQPALVIRDDPGSAPDIDAGMHLVRLEATSWARTPREAKQGYLQLLDFVEHLTERHEVQTQNGRALLYYILMDSGVVADTDPDILQPYARVYLRAAVAMQAIG